MIRIIVDFVYAGNRVVKEGEVYDIIGGDESFIKISLEGKEIKLAKKHRGRLYEFIEY